jgi:PAS domain S-box-containing protein
MSDNIRVLIVEDIRTDAELVEREVKETIPNSEFLVVETREDFLTALSVFNPDAVLSDYKLPNFDGMTALQLTLKHSPCIPFILITGSMNEDIAVKCMRAGAWDYIIKDRIKRLGPAVEGGLQRASMLREQKIVEVALKTSELQYRRLFETAKDGILILDANTGMILDVNPFLVDLLGYSSEYFLGKKIWEIGTFKDSIVNQANFVELQENKYVRYEDMPLQTSHGKLVDVEFVSNTYNVGNKKLAQCNIRDISARVLSLKKNLRLENELHQSQKMEAIGQLAGGVAHDFNNMLGVILGHTEMSISQLSPSHPLYDTFQEIHKAAKRSAQLVNNLLAFARKQPIMPQIADVNNSIENIEKMVKQTIGENVKLECHFDKSLWPIKIDPSQFDQIIINLSVNARDAIDGIGKIIITTKNATMNDELIESFHIKGDYVLLEIIDTGCGMSKEVQSHIFEPFFTTKEKGKGTGLGLATVYGIVKQNNGYIKIISEINRGTTFKIYFPRYKNGIKPELKTIESMKSGSETILIVEDELSLLNLITKMLEKQGYTVVITDSPKAAICLAEKIHGKIDLLLTDVIMPEISGKDLMKTLSTTYPRIKSIFMSGYTENIISQSGLLDKNLNFIQKPFSLKDLSILIRKVLDE